MFIPRYKADLLRNHIVEAEAAQATLNQRGIPSEPEGRDARGGIEHRRERATEKLRALIAEIVARGRVFQGGGNEASGDSLTQQLESAVADSLARLFPRFGEADHRAWSTAFRHAKAGADQPFKAVGHLGGAETHVVSRRVCEEIGAGSRGSSIRATLEGPPYGWPRDAVDAALIALHRLQYLTASINGESVAPGQLTQQGVAKAEFRVEHVTLTQSDRLALRRVFQKLEVSCKPGREAESASTFLQQVLDLAASTGGPPPLPTPPSTIEIETLRRLTGNEQLLGIVNLADELEQSIEEWQQTKDKVGKRVPAWDLTKRLADHARGIPDAAHLVKEVEAVEEQRLLLKTPDPLHAVQSSLSALIREAYGEALRDRRAAYVIAISKLDADKSWTHIGSDEQARICERVGLREPPQSDVSTQRKLVDCLDREPFEHVKTAVDAYPVRVSKAIEQAARSLEPEVSVLRLETATLRDTTEVEAWSKRQKKRLLAAVAKGPVLVK